MTIRTNPYETALESFLRDHQIPYIAVDERRRSLFEGGSLKSLDFIVTPEGTEMSWLIDVKGRRFPSGRKNRYWKNWTTTDDLRSLSAWQRLLPNSCALLVFIYEVTGNLAPLPQSLLHPHGGRLYAPVAMRLDLYLAWARRLSPRWKTMSMPTTAFRQLAQPLQLILREQPISQGDFDQRWQHQPAADPIAG